LHHRLPKLSFLIAVWLLIISAPAADAQPTQAASPIPTTIVPIVIATGNTFQSILPAVPVNSGARRSLTIQNNNAVDSCWLQIMGSGVISAAKATSILLLAGGAYTRYSPYVPSDAIQATCAATSDTLYVDYQ
jgi:hypothetical protein